MTIPRFFTNRFLFTSRQVQTETCVALLHRDQSTSVLMHLKGEAKIAVLLYDLQPRVLFRSADAAWANFRGKTGLMQSRKDQVAGRETMESGSLLLSELK